MLLVSHMPVFPQRSRVEILFVSLLVQLCVYFSGLKMSTVGVVRKVWSQEHRLSPGEGGSSWGFPAIVQNSPVLVCYDFHSRSSTSSITFPWASHSVSGLGYDCLDDFPGSFLPLVPWNKQQEILFIAIRCPLHVFLFPCRTGQNTQAMEKHVHVLAASIHLCWSVMGFCSPYLSGGSWRTYMSCVVS